MWMLRGCLHPKPVRATPAEEIGAPGQPRAVRPVLSTRPSWPIDAEACRVTINTYAHVLPALRQEAAEAINELFRA